jgi:demethylmacrocin O-methyltransferase
MSTDTPLIESVLLAASLSDAEILARANSLGPDAVAEVMLAEVASRGALLYGPADKLVVQCDLGFGGERLGYLITLGDGDPRVEKGWHGEAAATVRQDLVDLLRELFGPVGPYGATRELFAKELSDSEYSAPIATGVRQIVAAMSQRPNDRPIRLRQVGRALVHAALSEVLRAVPGASGEGSRDRDRGLRPP